MKNVARGVAGLSGAALIAGCAAPLSYGPPEVVARQTIRHGAGEADGQYALGKYYLGENRTALALVAFSKALDYEPEHAEALNGRASAMVRLGDVDSAIADLEHAVRLVPQASHLKSNLGYAYFLKGQYAKAAQALRAAFELDPRNARVRANWEALVAKASTDPAVASALGERRSLGEPGIEALAAIKTPPTQGAVNEILAQAVVTLSYDGVLANMSARQAAIPKTTAAASVTATTVTTIVAPATLTAASASATTARAPATGTSTFPLSTNIPEPTPKAPDTARSDPLVAPAPNRVVVPARVEIANGNGVRGLAKRVGQQFRSNGVKVVRVTNERSFTITTSRVSFRDGYMSEALTLSRRLGIRPAVMLDNGIDRHVDVRLVLGKDVSNDRQLALDHDAVPTRLAAIDVARNR